MRKKIDFSMATTTEEIKAILNMPEDQRTYLIQQAIAEEAERREMAISVAKQAHAGLYIQKYEYRTEYFLDFDTSEGDISEMKFSGMNDLRNV